MITTYELALQLLLEEGFVTLGPANSSCDLGIHLSMHEMGHEEEPQKKHGSFLIFSHIH